MILIDSVIMAKSGDWDSFVIVSHLLVKSEILFHKFFKGRSIVKKNHEENREVQTEIEVVKMQIDEEASLIKS